MALPDTRVLVMVVGSALGLVGVLVCLRLASLKREQVARDRLVRLGFVVLPALAFYKLLALFAFLVLPPATVGVAAYHLLDGVRETESCLKCHVMHPMGNDLKDEKSNTLAARHYRNRWIPDKHCYHCHTDYGFAGTVEAKMEGFRHLARYTTRTYREPIAMKHVFENSNCLHCHEGTPAFTKVTSHATVGEALHANTMSCLNCHGPAHPTRAQRTPGSADYERVMGRE